jgi:DNA-binding transcriptional regulator YdaS (Cro superfamily)
VEITVQVRAIRKAVEIVGGEEQLGARLGLSVGTVRLFGSGRIRLPQRLFLLVVDIISGDPASVENAAEEFPLHPRAMDRRSKLRR